MFNQKKCNKSKNEYLLFSVSVEPIGVDENIIYNCEYGRNKNTYVITLKESKQYIINFMVELEFTSKLTSTLQGFYEASYYDAATKENKIFLNTQFSPVDARRAFPCFDDPGKKAIFNIKLIRPMNMTTSISNMPLKNSTYVYI